MSEIVWYLSSADWLISLSIMFLRSIHTVTKGQISFLFYRHILLHCVHVHRGFIHSCTHGHLGGWYTLATVNRHVLRSGVQPWVWRAAGGSKGWALRVGGGEFWEQNTSFSFVTTPHPLNVCPVKCRPQSRGSGLPSISAKAKPLKTQVPQNELDT